MPYVGFIADTFASSTKAFWDQVTPLINPFLVFVVGAGLLFSLVHIIRHRARL